MEIRRATNGDMEEIQAVFATARAFMAANGNTTQWREGYPSRELLAQDMAKDQLYVCQDEGGIQAVFVFFVGVEPTYGVIEGGTWLSDEPYGVMHRLASAGKKSGMAKLCIDWAYARCGNLRAETHADNAPMQHIMEKNGFKRCGVIHLKDGTPRFGYQKL